MNKFEDIDSFVYNGTTYYCRDHFLRKFPEARTEREKDFMQEHGISSHTTMYGTYTENKVWECVPKASKTSLLAIPFHRKETLEHVLDRVKSIALDNSLAAHRKKYIELSKTLPPKTREFYDPNADVPDAPPQIEMTASEKYVDGTGKPIELYMCGNREISKCYFLSASVEIGFCTSNINKAMLRPDTGYHYRFHYDVFMYLGKKYLFLTYFGMVSMLKNTLNLSTEIFENWACQTLFTVRHGSGPSKRKLAKEMIGMTYETLKSTFGSGTEYNALSGVYLIALEGDGVNKHLKYTPPKGRAGKIHKLGCSQDIVKRMEQHKRTYGAIPGCKLLMVGASYIDPLYYFEAETELKFWAGENGLISNIEGHSELVYLTSQQLKRTTQMMSYIGKKYRGEITAIHNLLEKERNEHRDELSKLKIEKYEEYIAMNDKYIAQQRQDKENYERLLAAERARNEAITTRSEQAIAAVTTRSEQALAAVTTRSEQALAVERARTEAVTTRSEQALAVERTRLDAERARTEAVTTRSEQALAAERTRLTDVTTRSEQALAAERTRLTDVTTRSEQALAAERTRLDAERARTEAVTTRSDQALAIERDRTARAEQALTAERERTNTERTKREQEREKYHNTLSKNKKKWKEERQELLDTIKLLSSKAKTGCHEIILMSNGRCKMIPNKIWL